MADVSDPCHQMYNWFICLEAMLNHNKYRGGITPAYGYCIAFRASKLFKRGYIPQKAATNMKQTIMIRNMELPNNICHYRGHSDMMVVRPPCGDTSKLFFNMLEEGGQQLLLWDLPL